MRCSMIIFAISLSLFVGGDIASSSTLTVGDGGYTQIQDAIDVAVDGDEIIVTSGTYYENIEFNGKNIILRSTDPLNQDIVTSTVIDGQGLQPVVTFNGDEGTTCVLSGLTLRNGLGQEVYFDLGYEIIYEYWGAGVLGNYTGAQIDHCIIRENTGHSGLAVWLAGSLWYNIIEDNIDLEHTGSMRFGYPCTIRSCVGEVAYNTIKNSYQGGGIRNSAYYIHHNLITQCSYGIGGCFGDVSCNMVVNNNGGV